MHEEWIVLEIERYEILSFRQPTWLTLLRANRERCTRGTKFLDQDSFSP